MVAVVKRATYEDVLSAPADKVAEILAGELHLSPRPAGPHTAAASALGEELGPPFKRGRGGPGGWIILDEPELHLTEDILVPDLAGWRRDRMPLVPNVRENVRHAWLVNPLQRMLEVFVLEQGRWVNHATYKDDAMIRAAPFDAIQLDLSILWADFEPG